MESNAIGRLLRARRRELRLTQEALARISGHAQRSVSAHELGLSTHRILHSARLLAALQLSPEAIIAAAEQDREVDE